MLTSSTHPSLSRHDERSFCYYFFSFLRIWNVVSMCHPGKYARMIFCLICFQRSSWKCIFCAWVKHFCFISLAPTYLNFSDCFFAEFFLNSSFYSFLLPSVDNSQRKRWRNREIFSFHGYMLTEPDNMNLMLSLKLLCALISIIGL